MWLLYAYICVIHFLQLSVFTYVILTVLHIKLNYYKPISARVALLAWLFMSRLLGPGLARVSLLTLSRGYNHYL